MKGKNIFFIAIVCLSFTLAGCGNTQVQSEALDSKWIAGEMKKQDYPVNLAAFRTKDIGITVGYAGEIHYTTDGGANWPEAENKSKCCFGVDFVGENIIYVSGNGSNVVKSIDAGKTISRVADFGGTSPSQCKLLSFIDEDNGIIASAKRMAITSDGAQSWNELTIPCEVVGMEMVSPEHLYYIGKDFNMYQSTDGGLTWSFEPLNLPMQAEYINLPQSAAFTVDENGYTIYVTEKESKLLKNYVTTDNCATWVEYKLPPVEKHYNLYLNDDGNILTANDGLKSTFITLSCE